MDSDKYDNEKKQTKIYKEIGIGQTPYPLTSKNQP